MPFSTEDFVQLVQEEIRFRERSYSGIQSAEEAFAQWVVELLFPSVDTDLAATELVTTDVWGLTACHRDEDSGTMYLLYTRYSEDPQNSQFGTGVAHALFEACSKVRELAEQEGPVPEGLPAPVAGAVEACRSGYSLAATLVVFGHLEQPDRLGKLAEAYNLDIGAYQYCDLQRLRRIYSGVDEDQAARTIRLETISRALLEGPVAACVANISAYEMQQAIRDLVPEIYEINLRVPLKNTKVNKDIAATLKSDERRFFWYYNNGITMLCSGFEVSPTGVLTVQSPRIVNGAQTTDSLLEAELSPDSGVAVLVRVIAALPGSTQVTPDLQGSDALQDLHLDIARYTNRQNPIQDPDFRSNEIVQKRLHEGFLALGYFYEHRRGQWESFADKAAFRGKRIKMEDLAQRWFAFDGQPATAVREKLSLFEEQGNYGSIFMLGRSPQDYLVAYLVFDQLQGRLSDDISRAKARQREAGHDTRLGVDTQNFLMIGRATRLAVAHMTALLGNALSERYGPLKGELLEIVLSAVQDGNLVKETYPELVDALFRLATSMREDRVRTLHNRLSEKTALEDLKGLFNYVIEREQARGRDVLALPVVPAEAE